MTPDREYDLKLPEEYVDKFNLVANDIPTSEKPQLCSVRTAYIKHRIKRGETLYIKHRIKRGETLYSIARKYHVSVSQILSHNRLGSKRMLIQGKRLTIPVKGKNYASRNNKNSIRQKHFQVNTKSGEEIRFQ